MERESLEESLAMLKGMSESPVRSPLSIRKGRGRGRGRGRGTASKGRGTAVKKTPPPPKEEDLFDILKSDEPSDASSEDEAAPSPVVEEEPVASPSDSDSSSSEDEAVAEEAASDDSDDADSDDDSDDDSEDAASDDSDAASEDGAASEDEVPTEAAPAEEDEVSVSSTKILPITPKRFTVSTPRTPSERLDRMKKSKKSSNVLEKLKDFRYSLLRFVYIDNAINYVVCYDPYGQIVFVSCEGNNIERNIKDNVDKVDVIKLKTVPEELDNPLDEAFVNAVKENVDMGVFGIIFYNGEDYQICERNKRGFFKDRYCKLRQEKRNERLSLPQSFIIVKYQHIFETPLETIEVNKNNYENIQRQQLASSKHTFREIVESLKRLNKIVVEFDRVNHEHSKGVLTDWKAMGKHVKKFYEMYSEQDLDDDEKEKYDLVSLNMFLRFQFHNQNIERIDRLFSIKEHLDKSEEILEVAISEINEKNENVLTEIVDREVIDKYV